MSKSQEPVAPAIGVKDRKHEDASFLELDEETMDPTRHYRWVRRGANDSSIVRHKQLGYELEERGGEVRTKATPDNAGDTTIVIGDVVLMSCPVEVYDARVKKQFARREEILASTSAETERRAKEKGIKLIQDADHGKET
jgi:hypothetical protein